jgi:GR25 family glycosyltransferase involved in LPS biosynthesis
MSKEIAGEQNSRPTTIIGRKLRPLVISMGGERETHIRALFDQMKEDFEEPVFSPGIPQRSLRTRSNFFPIAYEAGLIPEAEWEALKVGIHSEDYQLHTKQLYECLKDIPVTEHRKGNDNDVKLHYSVELWRKAKGLNRGRAVLACTLAHLTAMKKCVDEGFDFILEDNVRAPMEECASRVRETIHASEELVKETGDPCHMRYFGWLGSIPNLKWVLNTHSKRMGYKRKQAEDALCIDNTVFPLPVSEDFGCLADEPEKEEEDEKIVDEKGASRAHKKPGGTAIWGAYAYWISKEGYEALMERLRLDVGALMWKGKRMRCFIAKPVDKVMPRQIVASYCRECIHVANCPAFFRAPMLTSKIHAQWDPEFCKSTEYQLSYTMLGWEDLWLTQAERSVVSHKKLTGEWITTGRLLEIQTGSDESIQD